MAISALPASGTISVPEKPTKSQPANSKRGTGSIYRRGSIYWIRYWRRGRKFCESSGSSDPDVAQKKLDKRMKEIWAERQGLQAFVPKAEKVYVDELLDELEKDYKLSGGRGLPQLQSHLKPIREAFGDMRAVDVTSKAVDEYIDEGNKRAGVPPKAPTTINRETQLLGQAFALGIERREILNAPHIRHLPERSVRQGFFEKAEFEAVVAHLPEYLQDFSRFAYLCAWRKGQIASLTWTDVDRNAGVIVARAEHVKNGREHKLALDGELAEVIERRWTARKYCTKDEADGISQYVFHHDGQPIVDPRKAWASACKAAGFMKPKMDRVTGEPVTVTVDDKEQPVMVRSRLFHDLRRSGVRNMVRAGEKVSQWRSAAIERAPSSIGTTSLLMKTSGRLCTTEHLAAQPAERKVVSIRK